MLLELTPGKMTAGPLDVILILHHKETGRFHACFAEEYPLPGPVGDVEDRAFVRLKSKMHHTEGAETLLEAREHVTKMREKIEIEDENVWPEPRPWDGEAFVIVVPNWKCKPDGPKS